MGESPETIWTPTLRGSWPFSGQGEFGRWSVASCPPLGGRIDFEADCLGTGSRLSSTESSSFKVGLKCHLLCRLPSPEAKLITRPLCSHGTAWSLPSSLITSDADLCVYQSVLRPDGDFCRQSHLGFCVTGPGQCRAHCGCSESHELKWGA